MASERLIAHLEEEGADYQAEEHPVAYTAQEVAATERVSGWLVAKTVMLEADGDLVMVVLPAPLHVDLGKAAEALGASRVRLAEERVFSKVFPDCEPGAEPPFGKLYGVPVYVDRALREDPEIVFRDGTHQGTIRMRLEDYLRLADPVEIDVGVVVD